MESLQQAQAQADTVEEVKDELRRMQEQCEQMRDENEQLQTELQQRRVVQSEESSGECMTCREECIDVRVVVCCSGTVAALWSKSAFEEVCSCLRRASFTGRERERDCVAGSYPHDEWIDGRG